MKPAIFLDRDGVLIEDVNLLTRPADIHILPGVPEALSWLRAAGFNLIVVTNQTVIARGWLDELGVQRLEKEVERQLELAGGPCPDAFYFCPHHPNATISAYRRDCECRKPRPGLLVRAARDLELDLDASFLVGDRNTDILAGARAGCRTVLVETGAHLAPPIETSEPVELPSPDYVCADLGQAAQWILEVM